MTKFTRVYPGQWAAIDHQGNQFMIFHTKHSQNTGAFSVYCNGTCEMEYLWNFPWDKSAREALDTIKRIAELPSFTGRENGD